MREHQPLFLLVATDRVGGMREEKDRKREGANQSREREEKTGREELVTCRC